MNKRAMKLRAGLSRLQTEDLGARVPSLSVGPEAQSVQGGSDCSRELDSLRARMSQMRRSRSRKKKKGGATGLTDAGMSQDSKRYNVPGEVVQTKWGDLQRVVWNFCNDDRHGEFPIGGALAVGGEGAAHLATDEALGEFDPRSALFIDTETTGLAGGSGTIPFLIGIGFYTEEGFRVEQLILTQLGEEKPLLQYLGQKIAEATSLVSFNGKSYDWPLLRTRFVMNRVEVPSLPPHFDLLHAARRVLKYRLAQTKLTILEREVLHFYRVGDIPGADIPERFFRFLRTGDGGLLTEVVEHNRHDIVTMSAFLGVLHGYVYMSAGEIDARVQLAVAQLKMRMQDSEAALMLLRAVCESEIDTSWKWDAFILGATILRRSGEFEEAEAWLRQAIGLNVIPALRQGQAHLMLAKLYEHQFASYTKALWHAKRATGTEPEGNLERRIERILAKKERAVSSPAREVR